MNVLSCRERITMSYSELIDQYEKMLRDILILRSKTQTQIKSCAAVRDVKINHQVQSNSATETGKVVIKKEEVV